MRRSRFKKYGLPLVVLLVLAAIGAASTNALGGTSALDGQDTAYGTITVSNSSGSSGVTISDIKYTTDAPGANITSVALTFNGMTATTTSPDVVTLTDTTSSASFNCTAPGSGPSSYTITGTGDVYTCDVSAGGGLPVGTFTGASISVLPYNSTVG